MVDIVYQTYAFAHGKCAKVFGDKNNYYVEHIDSIQKVFPNSKMVFYFEMGETLLFHTRILIKIKLNLIMFLSWTKTLAR